MGESGTFFWPEIKGNGLIGSKEVMINITEERLRNSFAQFIINPYNRTNTDKIPDSLEHMEENHEINAPPHDEWNAEKENQFKRMAEKAYSSLLETDLDGLVEKYFELSKVTWLDKLFIKEFNDITLDDFKDPTKVKEFIGESQEFGQSDLSHAQQDIIDNKTIMSKKEFFDRRAFDKNIAVKYVDGKNQIEVSFVVDHTQGEVNREIINRAWPSAKIALESDRGSTHVTTPRLGYNYQKEKDSITSTAKGTDPTNVWYQAKVEPKKIPKRNKELYEKWVELDREANKESWKRFIEEKVITDPKGRPLLTPKFSERPVKRVDNPKVIDGVQPPKDTPKQTQAKDRIAGEWRETLRREGKKPSKKELKEFEEQFGSWRGKEQEKGHAAVVKLDEKNSIEMNVEEYQLISTIFHWFETKTTSSRQPARIKELFTKLLEGDKIYNLIKGKIDLSPKYLRKFTFTFIIKSPELLKKHGLKNYSLWMPTNIKIEANKKISMGHLYKLSKKPTIRGKGTDEEKESPQKAYKPKLQNLQSSEKWQRAEAVILDPKSGFNEARNHLATLIQSGIRRLEQAAPYLR